MQQIRTFQGGLNTDDSAETMDPNDYPFLLNGIKAKSYGGQGGSIENQLGTLAVATGVTELDANSTCIGAIRDQKNSAWYCFFYNTTAAKNCIVKLDSTGVTKVISGSLAAWVSGTHYTVGAQVTSGGFNWTSLTDHTDTVAPVIGPIWIKISWGGLAFNLNNLVTGGAVSNGVIYFTDGLNGLRSINSTKYAGGGIPLKEEDIALLKRGGIASPTFSKSYDGTVNANMIGRFAFQFAYQYVYDDNQFSVLSPYSTLCIPNTLAQNYNKVTIGVPDNIPDGVKKVKFAARIGNDGKFFYIGDYLRVGTTWASSINFPFYNNTNGPVVADVYENAFHAVPLIAKCMETIKNRLWLGYYTEGYDAPLDSGIAISQNNQNIVAGSGLTVPKEIFRLQTIAYVWDDTLGVAGAYGFISINWGSYQCINSTFVDNNDGTQTIIGHGVKPSGPNYIDEPLNDISVISQTDIPDIYTGTLGYSQYSLVPLVGSTVNYIATTINALDYDGLRTFSSGSSYKAGYIFKDEYGRTSGVVSGVGSVFNTVAAAYNNSLVANWSLPSYWLVGTAYVIGNTVIYGGSLWKAVANNTGVTPIAGANWSLMVSGVMPPWAKTYSIVMSKNLTKSYFLEYRSSATAYFNNGIGMGTTYDAVNQSIAINVGHIDRAGLGYNFVDGDRIIIYPTNVNGTANGVTAVFDLPIRSYDGTYIMVPNVNVGTFSSTLAKTTFEIYRPINNKSDVLYFELGQSYQLGIATNGDAYFPVMNGPLNGDCVDTARPNFVASGTTFIVDTNDPLGVYKAMSSNPTGAWDTDSGKPYVEATIGQVVKKNYFRFSSTIINDTNVNGLCEFYALDESNTPQEHGEINKLKNVSREKDEATVLLAICRNGASSIYVDQTHMNLDQTTSFLVQSADVIGGDKSLKGSYGTFHPESVYDLKDDVYWYDGINGRHIRYAANGLVSVSDNKMIHHFEDMRTALKATPSRVVSGYDPFYRLIYLTCPQSATNRKTVSWDEKANRYISFHSFIADWYVDIEGVGYSMKAGTFYKHNNSAAFNTFYGAVADTVLELNFNDNAADPKEWMAVSILVSKNFWTWIAGEQTITTGFLKFELENGYGQGTDVSDARFDLDENVAYSTIYKDKNTVFRAWLTGTAYKIGDVVTNGGFVWISQTDHTDAIAPANGAIWQQTTAYLVGDDLFSQVALGRVTIFGQASDVWKQIKYVRVGYETSKGHEL